MLHPAAKAAIYSHGECKGRNISTVNSVSEIYCQNYSLLLKEHHGKGLPACCLVFAVLGLNACGSVCA